MADPYGGQNAGSPVLVDPVTAFNFGLEVGNVVIAAFTEVSGFSAQMEVFEYKEGGFNEHTHKFPGRTTLGNVTLKWGMTDSTDLWDWYMEVVGWTSSRSGSNPRRDISIVHFGGAPGGGSGRAMTRRWDLLGAFPVKWTGPAWNTTQSQVAIESIELAYRDLGRRA